MRRSKTRAAMQREYAASPEPMEGLPMSEQVQRTALVNELRGKRGAERCDTVLRHLGDQVLHKDFRIAEKAIDEERRTVKLSFASEDAYRRWWGVEILDCRPSSVRMARLNDGAALLLNHWSDNHIGVVEKASLDKDRVGRATVRLSRSQLGEEVWQDIQDGIRTKVSVGYVIHKMVLEEEDDEKSTYRVTDWEPLEISIVSVPADATVGVGRSRSASDKETSMTEAEKQAAAAAAAAAAEPTPAAKLSADLTRQNAAVTQAAFEQMAARNAQMQEIAARFEAVPGVQDAYKQAHVNAKMTVDAFREVILDLVDKHQAKPTRTGQLEEDRRQQASYGSMPRGAIHGSIKAFKGVGARLGMTDEEAAYRAGMWGLARVTGNVQALRWCADAGMRLLAGDGFDGATFKGAPMDVRAMSEGVFTSAGWLVPAEMSTAIIINRELYGVARRICRMWPMNSATLQIPRWTGGTTSYFVGEGSEGTSSDVSGDQVTLVLKDLMTTTRIGKSTMQDAAIPMAEFLASEHARSGAVKEDGCLIVGDGTSTYGGMQGVRTLLNDSNYAGGKIAAATNHDLFSEIDATDIASLMGILPVYARAGARFVCSGVAEANVFGRLKLSAGGNDSRTLRDGVLESDYGGFPTTCRRALPPTTAASP
jgi:HK97 family phage major capsid protein/HK97 family phage prohead protease